MFQNITYKIMLCEIYANDKIRIFPLYLCIHSKKKQDYRNSLLFKHIIYPNVNTKKKFVKMIHSFPTNIFFLSVNETKDEKAFIPF